MSDTLEELSRGLEDIVNFEYDVFLIFATDDEALARKVCEGLEQNNKRCIAQFKHDAFQVGHNVFDNVVKNVSRSNTALLLFTEKSFESHWVTLETILALEESTRSNKLRLRLLVHSVDEKNMKFLKLGVLASVPLIKVDLNRNDWSKELAEEISRDIPLPDVLPIGSMAHGLVFSHYTGFLSYVLPVLKEKLKETKIYKRCPEKVSLKYNMLLPGSCRIYDDLTSNDEENGIEIQVEESLEFSVEHAGKPRKYTLTIYKITREEQDFYFFADFPFVLNSMFQMEEKQLAVVDIRFQVARFYYTMNEMINHAENQVCHNTVQLILFNEIVESMQDALWHAVSTSIQVEATQLPNEEATSNQQQPIERLFGQQSANDGEENDVTITCCEDCPEDINVVEEINQYLNKCGKKVKLHGKKALSVPKAKWYIFVLSKKALELSDTLTFLCTEALAESLGNNELRVLVVIRDVDPRHIPRFIKSVNMLKTSEPNYCEKILKSMTGDVLRLEHSLPAGDVATGLGWAYVINYLMITLLGKSSEETGYLNLKQRIQKFLKDNNIKCGCIYKMFIVLPKSCTTTPNIEKRANESGNGSTVVTHLGMTEPVVCDTGGQKNRKLYLHIYKHEDKESRRTVCFIAEYCTPANCMRQMVEEFKFAGLSEEEMSKQCDDFTKLLPSIIEREAVKRKLGDISNLVQLICYDDRTETLMSAIENNIAGDGTEMIYAEEMPRTGEQNYHLPC